MRKYLKIADIFILFEYSFNDYFSDKINAYETLDLNHDFVHFTVTVEKDIKMPNREITFTYKNRFKMETEKDCYLVTKDEDSIKHIIYYTNDFKEVKIQLNESIGKKLSEYEYVLSGMFFFGIAISHGYLPIHASAIHHKKNTFLLSGPSKSGKSTQTKLFLNEFPDALIINEDKPIIFSKDNKLYVSGSPWSGKHVINDNSIYPLDYIFFINKSDNKAIIEMDKTLKIKELFRNIHRPGEKKLIDHTIKVMNQIILDTPLYMFHCINDESSAYFLNKFMEDNYENKSRLCD